MRHRHRVPRVLASMVEFVTDLVFDDKGGASSKGLGDNDLDSAVGWHFGFYSRPLDGAVGVVVKAGGEGGTSFLMAYRDGQFEMSLQKGECGMQNAFGASLLLDKNGNLTSVPGGSGKVLLGAANGTQPAVLGNSLETRLSDLESKFTAHTHVVTTTSACTAGGASASGTAAATTSTLPHSADNIKSSKAEVAP